MKVLPIIREIERLESKSTLTGEQLQHLRGLYGARDQIFKQNQQQLFGRGKESKDV